LVLADGVDTRRLNYVLERAARIDWVADGASADGQARNTLRSPRSEEERCGRADFRANDMRSSQAPLVDQTSTNVARCPGRSHLGDRRSARIPQTCDFKSTAAQGLPNHS
jgi:hypothetical protein